MIRIFSFFALAAFLLPFTTTAQELVQDIQATWESEVVRVLEERTETIEPAGIERTIQVLEVIILEGEREGELLEFENDFVQLESGDRFFLNYLKTVQGNEFYTVADVDGRSGLVWLLGIFVAAVLLFAGKQGLRSLASLLASLFLILYLLIPSLAAGTSPVLISILVAAAVLFVAIYVTHGVNIYSSIALLGTLISVTITGLLAWMSIYGMKLSGFASEEAIYLNINSGGSLDLAGILLASIIIGALGVLDDIAITQVAVVREMIASNKTIKLSTVYTHAMRVGREHIGAVINTLFLAYAGAALPLLLLFADSTRSFGFIVNREIFAAEIVRALVGSIGLILTVPITTLLAIELLRRYRNISASTHTHAH